MDKKYLIIGHGLAGCVLALCFLRRNISFKLIGMSMRGEASMASSGLINPVTGRKYVKSWMIDEFIDAAIDFYKWTEELLGRRYFFEVDIIRFLSHPEALIAWELRSKDPNYARYISTRRSEDLDRLDRSYGILTGGYRLDAPTWLKDVRHYLSQQGVFEDRNFSLTESFHGFDSIIYATGAAGPSFSAGLIPNKGEALIVKMPDWKFPGIVKEEVFFVPLEEKDIFWVGSYYQRWPDNPDPSPEGRHLLIKAIKDIYDGSFVVLDHLSGIRPTVDDRRPLVGPIEGDKTKYLFNGMGTKGTSLAPYWAEHLVSHLVQETPILRIVHPGRYKTQQSG